MHKEDIHLVPTLLRENAKWIDDMMKRYPTYKVSGVEWIGEIPEHWDAVKLKYSDKVIMGQSPSSDDYNDLKEGFPFLQGNADFTSLYPNPRIWCDTARKYAEKDDVLLSVRAPIGAANIADQKYGIGRGLCAIRSEKSLPALLFYFAISLNDELNGVGTGSTYTAISVDDVENIFIPNIPLPEQQSIADYLDRKTRQIDALIEKKQKQIDLLKEQRTAIINQTVTKGLDPNVKMKDSGIDWLGEIPEHWEAKKLKYCDLVIMGQSPSSEDYNTTFVGLPFLQGNADFTEGYPKPRIWCNTANKVAATGDILLSVRAPIGAVNIADQKYGIGPTLSRLLPHFWK